MRFHPILYSSNALRRVCRATYQAETYQLQLGVEAGDLIRAAIVDMKGTLSKDWMTSSAAQMQMTWYTDSNYLERLVMGKTTDKRLELSSRRRD